MKKRDDPPPHKSGDPDFPEYPTPDEIAERVEQQKDAVCYSWVTYWEPIAQALMERCDMTRSEAITFLWAKEGANFTNALNRFMNTFVVEEEGDDWKDAD
jgi:hypothetical protein